MGVSFRTDVDFECFSPKPKYPHPDRLRSRLSLRPLLKGEVGSGGRGVRSPRLRWGPEDGARPVARANKPDKAGGMVRVRVCGVTPYHLRRHLAHLPNSIICHIICKNKFMALFRHAAINRTNFVFTGYYDFLSCRKKAVFCYVDTFFFCFVAYFISY